MKSLYTVIVFGLFSTVSAGATAAEPIECESSNHNACYSIEMEEIPMINGYDMCQYRKQAGISTVFEGDTYFVTIDPSAPGAAGVPLAFLPEHHGKWKSWKILNHAFEQLLIGTDCHGVPEPSFPRPDLCNPTGAQFNFDIRANVNWLDPASGEVILNANMDAFYGAFTDKHGQIRIQDVGIFELAGDTQCADGQAENNEGDVLAVKQCSRIVAIPESNIYEIPCGPNGNDEQFPSFFEVPQAQNYFAEFSLNGVPDEYLGGGNYASYAVDAAQMNSYWFDGGSLSGTAVDAKTNTTKFGVDKDDSDGACGIGFVNQSGFGDILLETAAGTGTCQ